MVLLQEAIEEKKLDTRVVEKNLARKVITEKELAQSAQSLPDDSENADWVDLEKLAQDDSSD